MAEDRGDYKLNEHFKKGINFIRRNMKKGNVFVHCAAGKSRSGTMTIAYIMKS